MRHRSPVWIALAKYGRFHFETKARIGTTEYTAISAPRVDRAVMGTPLTVGGCTSATLNLSILTDDNIASSTPIVILGRLTDGVNYSEWLEFGTFYINQRDTSYAGLLTFNCYDAMLKANQNYLDGSDTVGNWPKAMKSVVEEIAYRIGVSVDPRTQINVGDDYMVPIPTDLTMMQVLSYIGACHGGNWIITEDNALRLVPLASAPVTYSSTAETPESLIPETYYITDENDLTIETPEGHALVWAVDGSADPADGLTTVTAVLGQLTNGTAVTVTGIVMSDNKGNSYTAGTKDGSVITIDGNPYANQNICDALYEKYNGLVYEPYTASKTVYDPATELGDQIIIGDKVQSILCTAKMVMDLGFRSDISAPNSEALSEEYPYLTTKKQAAVAAKQTQQQIDGVQASVPTAVSELENDTGYQTESGVVSIIDGRITADYIEALEISVAAAKITGQLTAQQIDATDLNVSAANITGQLKAQQIDTADLNVSAANVTGQLTASQIDATDLKVSAANITGSLTIGQLPGTVAETDDIPTAVSELENDTGYQTESGVVSIIDGRITADYIEALGISASSIQITNASGYTLLDASGTSVNIGGFTVARTSSKSYIYSGKTSYSSSTSGVYLGTDGIGLGAGAFYVTKAGALYAKNAQISGSILSGGSITFDASYVTYDTESGELASETSYSASLGASGITLDTGSLFTRISNNCFYAISNADETMYQMNFGFSDVDWVNNEHTTTGMWVGQTINALQNGWKLNEAEGQLLLRVRDYTVFNAWVSNINTLPEGTTYGSLNLGASGMDIYPTGYWYFNEGTFTGSDRNIKNTITDISDAYSVLFDKLRPVSYKYNAGTSGRLHTGFIAQEVADAVADAGLSSLEFAGYAIHNKRSKDGTEQTEYYLRYEEFIALCVNEIQKLKCRVSELEKISNV